MRISDLSSYVCSSDLLDQSFLLQLQDGVADRRLADAVEFRQGRAGQAGAGLQFQPQDSFAQIVTDLLRRQSLAVDRKGRGFHRLEKGVAGWAEIGRTSRRERVYQYV